MKKLLLITLILFLMPFNQIRAEQTKDENSRIFRLDVHTLKYEQKQLVFAVITGNKNAVQTILNSDPSPQTTYAKIPLTMFAIHAKQNEILKMLIEDYMFNPDEKFMGVTPLELAVSLKRYDAIKYLLSIGVEPSDETLKLVEKSKNKKIKALFE